MKFDPEKHYLGKLCLRGHEYKNTGKTLRYKKSRGCAACIMEHKKAHPEYGYKGRVRTAYNQAYREKHRERLNAQTKAWAQKPEIKRRKAILQRINKGTEAYRKRHRKEHALKTVFLSDDYISAIFYKIVGVWITDKDLIQAKREQLLLTRELRKAKAEIEADIKLSAKIRKAKKWSREVEKLLLKEAVNGNDRIGDK
jgi:hypothetical protein